jgi:hypothetical protein
MALVIDWTSNHDTASWTTLLSPLRLTVDKSAPLATRKKVANHSPQNKIHHTEINKPRARISGVEISMCIHIDSKTCIEVTTLVTDSCLGLLPDTVIK